MKKLIFAIYIMFFSLAIGSNARAEVNIPLEQETVSPLSVREKMKLAKKQIIELRKEFRSEMKGMTKSEKKAFIESKVNEKQISANFRYLILALVCFLISGIAWVLPPVLDWLVSTVFGILGVVFLVLWILNIVQYS